MSFSHVFLLKSRTTATYTLKRISLSVPYFCRIATEPTWKDLCSFTGNAGHIIEPQAQTFKRDSHNLIEVLNAHYMPLDETQYKWK